MGPGGLPSLQNCVSGGAPLTGGFDSHAPSPRESHKDAENKTSERSSAQCLRCVGFRLYLTLNQTFRLPCKDGIQRCSVLLVHRGAADATRRRASVPWCPDRACLRRPSGEPLALAPASSPCAADR